MELRNFESKDAKKVSELIQRNILKITTEIYPKWVIEIMQKRYNITPLIDLSKKREFYLAINNKEIIGVISLDNNEIKTLYIDIDHQHKGIGSKLLTYIEEITKKRGYNTIEAHSIPNAYDFYIKNGYHKLKEKYERNTLTAIIMQKELNKK